MQFKEFMPKHITWFPSRIQLVVFGLVILLVISVFVALPARAAISFRSASSASNGGASTLSIPLPSGVAIGDVLIVTVDFRYYAEHSYFGQNGGLSFLNQATDNSTLVKRTYYKVITSTPPASYTFTFGTNDTGGTTSVKASGGIVAYTGVDQTNPIMANAIQTNGVTPILTAPSVTTTAPNAMIIAMFGTAVGTTIAPGSSMTERYEAASSGGNGSTRTTSQGQDIIQAASGASGIKSAEAVGAAVNIGHTVALASPASFSQASYRWFDNQDSTNVGTPLAAQNTSVIAPSPGTPFRLRMNVAVSSNSAASGAFKLQYAKRGSDNVCDTSFSGETYQDISKTTAQAVPGSGVNDTTAGTFSWSSPGNVLVDDTSYSTISSDGVANLGTSHYLKATGFGFNIPNEATITGITAEFNMRAGSLLHKAFLVKSGTILTGHTKEVSVNSTFAYRSVGSDVDKWATTWTPAEINSTGFGTAINLFNDGVAASSDVDNIRITVAYNIGNIQYYDNATPANASAVTVNANDPTDGRTLVRQTYQETNPFNIATSIPAGQDGLWDFALVTSNHAEAGSYCLRVVTSTGGVLNTYSQFPEISIDSKVSQENWRLYENGDPSIIDKPEKLADPATLPTGNSYGTAYSPDGQYLSVAHDVSPFLTIYKRSGDTLTKLANPATLPTGNGNATAWSPDGTYLTVTFQTSPYIAIYKRSGDTFTKLADPATLPTGSGWGTSFSPDGIYVSVSHQNSPYVTIYKRDGDTFTKLSNPATLPTGHGYGGSFSRDGNYLTIAHATSPFVTIYKRDGDTFTKLTNPTTLPTGVGYSTSFSLNDQYLSVAHNTSPFVTIYKRDGDTFTKLTNPTTLPTGVALSNTFSPDGLYLSVGHVTSPFVTIYKRSGDTFTKLADPATLPPGNGNATTFTPDGQYLSFANNNSPFMTTYRTNFPAEVGTPLGSQNTAATVNAGTTFRLRQLFEQTGGSASRNSSSYKLQYAAKSGICDVGFSGETYQNLYVATGGNATKSPVMSSIDYSNSGSGWQNPEYVTVSDDVMAYANFDGTNVPSAYLKATDFRFAIPSDATITGVEAFIEGHQTGPGGVYTEEVFLVKNDTLDGSVVPSGAWLANTDSVMTQGSPTSLWGTTITPADVNAAGFGFAFSALSAEQFSEARVDYMGIKVYYSVPVAGSSNVIYNTATGIASGVSLAINANDPTATGTIRPQTFVSTDPYANGLTGINFGESAMWDFAVSTTAEATGSYCFRVVKSDGSLLSGYSQIPEITIAGSGGGPATPTLDQQVRGGQSVVNGVKAPFSW